MTFAQRLLTQLLSVALLCTVMVVIDRVAPAPRAESYVQDTTSAPFVSLTPDRLRRFWSNQCAARGVVDDPSWQSAMTTLFSAANFPGVDATSLAFLRSFFVQVVHVGVP